jgi:hypothetical protein
LASSHPWDTRLRGQAGGGAAEEQAAASSLLTRPARWISLLRPHLHRPPPPPSPLPPPLSPPAASSTLGSSGATRSRVRGSGSPRTVTTTRARGGDWGPWQCVPTRRSKAGSAVAGRAPPPGSPPAASSWIPVGRLSASSCIPAGRLLTLCRLLHTLRVVAWRGSAAPLLAAAPPHGRLPSARRNPRRRGRQLPKEDAGRDSQAAGVLATVSFSLFLSKRDFADGGGECCWIQSKNLLVQHKLACSGEKLIAWKRYLCLS